MFASSNIDDRRTLKNKLFNDKILSKIYEEKVMDIMGCVL